MEELRRGAPIARALPRRAKAARDTRRAVLSRENFGVTLILGIFFTHDVLWANNPAPCQPCTGQQQGSNNVFSGTATGKAGSCQVQVSDGAGETFNVQVTTN